MTERVTRILSQSVWLRYTIQVIIVIILIIIYCRKRERLWCSWIP